MDSPPVLTKFHSQLVDWYIAIQPVARFDPRFLHGAAAFNNLKHASDLPVQEYQHIRSVEPNGLVLILWALSWSLSPAFSVSRSRGLSDATPDLIIEDFTEVLKMLSKQ